ncbi:MAG: insulinase family protein, partial [Bacilli bacterium]|nr:insulinase family protein [Bacilli bacterium]
KSQKSFIKPVYKRIQYPIGQEEESVEKTYLSYTTSVGKGVDATTWMAFNILSYILLDMPGAPLKQALLDAKIGKDITSSYYDGIEENMLTIIAKNAEEKDRDRFVTVIEKTLSDLVTQGLDKKAMQAAINKFEFQYREADFGRTPKGIMYVINTLDSWLYDENNPFLHLETEKVFLEVKELMNTDYFEKLIEKYILNNQHKVIITSVPDKEISKKKEDALKERLANFKNSLTDEELEKIISDTINLKKYQSTPATPEELATIPALSREDINKEASPIYNDNKEVKGIKVMHQNIFTNGIGYLRFLFDVKGLPNELLPYLGFLPYVLGSVDTKNYSYQDLNKEIDINSGGVNFGIDPVKTNNDYKLFFYVSSRVLYDKIDFSFGIIEEIINNSLLDNEKRLYEIVSEYKSLLEKRFSYSGHTFATNRALSYQSPLMYILDNLNGIEEYRFINNVATNFEKEKDNVIEKLKKLINHIFRTDNMIISYTANDEGYDKMVKNIPHLLESLKGSNTIASDFRFTPKNLNEGFKTSFNVQYVARSGNFVRNGYQYTGALQVLNSILSVDYLWNNVRVQGGAYGCLSGFDRFGDSFFVSYRDPNLGKTIKVYEGMVKFLDEFKASEEEMTKSIIGTIGAIDAPRTPAGRGMISRNLVLAGISIADIKKEREEIINCTEKDIKDLKKIVQAILDSKSLCTIGNETKIEAEKDLFDKVTYLFK